MGYILGIDEVGRGAWAGPLVVGAVIMGDFVLDGLTDSKLLSKPARRRFAKLIHENSLFATLGWASAKEIDGLGLTKAMELAISRAIEGVNHDDIKIIIDGNINYLKGLPNSSCMIKADMTIPAVSAASVIAKVARDDYMKNLGSRFPDFGFDSHVGYGTKRHADGLKKYGVCEEHRTSFKPVAVFA